jgi:hypothetical protein
MQTHKGNANYNGKHYDLSCIVVIQGELSTNIAQIKGMQIIITNIMVVSCIMIIQGELITNHA